MERLDKAWHTRQWKWKERNSHLPVASHGYICSFALPPQLFETLVWTQLSHSVHISLAAKGKIKAVLQRRGNERAPETQQGLPPHQSCEFLFPSQDSQILVCGKVSKGNFLQGLPTVKKYPVTELKSLEVVRGEKYPSREGDQEIRQETFLSPSMPWTASLTKDKSIFA